MIMQGINQRPTLKKCVSRDGTLRGRRASVWFALGCALLWWGSAPRAARADYIPNEIYVYYDVNHVPSATGNLTDVANAMFYTDPNIIDQYGNTLYLDTANSRVYDKYNNLVGFIYRG
jgi:hypothetical protein